MTELLFVYGTLRPTSGHPMAVRLAHAAAHRGTGWFEGVLFDLGEYPGAVALPGGARVHGELFALAAADPLWAALDDYEDVRAGVAAFARVLLDVWSQANRVNVRAQVYLYRGQTAGRRRIEGGDWRPARLR